MSASCEVLFRLDVLRSLNEHVTFSSFRTDEVEASCNILIKQIKSDLRRIASDKIICAIMINQFGADTEAHQAAMGVYRVDRNLFEGIFDDVFKEVADEDSFNQVVQALSKFEDYNATVHAYCSLYRYIGRLDECLWAFQCALGRLLKQSELEPKEKAKLNELLVNLKKKEAQHLQYAATLSAIEDMGSW